MYYDGFLACFNTHDNNSIKNMRNKLSMYSFHFFLLLILSSFDTHDMRNKCIDFYHIYIVFDFLLFASKWQNITDNIPIVHSKRRLKY